LFSVYLGSLADHRYNTIVLVLCHNWASAFRIFLLKLLNPDQPTGLQLTVTT
jgi:hypothetical protein